MKVATRVARNTMFLYAKMFLTVGLTLLATRIVKDALGDDGYGVYILVGVNIIGMLGFLNTAMASATQRFMSYSTGAGDKLQQKRIFNVSLVLHLGVAILVGTLMELAAIFLFDGFLNIPAERLFAAKIVYHFSVATTMLTIITVPYDAVINARENMLLYSIVGVVESALKLGAAVAIIFLPGDKLVNYGVLIAVATVVVLLIYRLYCHLHYEECSVDFGRYFDRELIKHMGLFSGWSTLTASTSMVTNSGVAMVLNLFFGPLLNAAQGLANQINVQLMGFSTHMTRALNPVIAKSEGDGNRTLMLKAVFTGSKAAFYLNSFIAVPFLIETPYILHLWLGSVPEWTVIICRLLLIKNVLESYSYTMTSSLNAQGNIRNMNIARSAIFLVCLPVIILLYGMDYPPYVAYLVLMVGSLLGFVVLLYYNSKNCGLDTRAYMTKVVGSTLAICAVATVCSLVPFFALPQGIGRLMAVVLVSLAVHGAVVYRFGLNDNEKQLADGIIGKLNKLLNRKY